METTGDVEFSAFKKAEKKYQLHRTQQLKRSKGRLRGKGWVVRETDLADVVDVHDETKRNWPGMHASQIEAAGKMYSVYSFDIHPDLWSHPGFYLIPQALSNEEQGDLVQQALEDFPNPPATTSLYQKYGDLPDLYAAASQDLYLSVPNTLPLRESAPDAETNQMSEDFKFSGTRQQSVCTKGEKSAYGASQGDTVSALGTSMTHTAHLQHLDPLANIVRVESPSQSKIMNSRWRRSTCGPSATSLLQKLRWAALGPHYNWSERKYSDLKSFRGLPPQLHDLGTKIANMLKIPFIPDAALVNYYHKGDTLGGHKDDAEHDLEQPIVSLSLGCSAVFLMGGDDKQICPTPLILHSGDVIVLSGQARKCFHGVPRVLTPQDYEKQEERMSKKVKSGGEGTCHDLGDMLGSLRINISIRAVMKKTKKVRDSMYTYIY